MKSAPDLTPEGENYLWGLLPGLLLLAWLYLLTGLQTSPFYLFQNCIESYTVTHNGHWLWPSIRTVARATQ